MLKSVFTYTSLKGYSVTDHLFWVIKSYLGWISSIKAKLKNYIVQVCLDNSYLGAKSMRALYIFRIQKKILILPAALGKNLRFDISMHIMYHKNSYIHQS